MSEGPTRSERDTLKGHRADKPYDRPPTRQPLRRSQSIVDSLRTIVARPFSWLTSGSAELAATSSTQHGSSLDSTKRVTASAISKRRASSTDTSEPEPTPKKRRRGSPNGDHTARLAKNGVSLRPSLSVPQLSSHSAGLRPSRASFLPPLPRTSTPNGRDSIEPNRLASPAIRASPSIGSAVYTTGIGSTPSAGFWDEHAEKTAFGLRYRSPFMPRASPAPALGHPSARGTSLSRHSSIFSERGENLGLTRLPKPRTTLAAEDEVTERGDSISPTHPTFSPTRSPSRRLSDTVSKELIPTFKSTTLRRAGSITASFPGTEYGSSQKDVLGVVQRQSSADVGAFTESTLAQAHRAISHVAARSNSPEKLSSERVFQALEEAMPWSQSRKFRHEQQARVKVPTPSTQSRLGGRAGRMVKPYGRVVDVEFEKGRDVEMGEAELNGPSKSDKQPQSLTEKRSNSKLKDFGNDEVSAVVVNHSAAPVSNVEVKKLVEVNDKPLFPIPSSSKSSMPATSLVPPLSVISEDLEPAESLPFALVPVEPPLDGVMPTTSPKDHPQSSLRAGRTRTTAVHASSAPRRPNGGTDKRPNRFAIDDEEGADDEKAEAEEAELKTWASKSGIALEVPTGWSFGGPKLATSSTPASGMAPAATSSSSFFPPLAKPPTFSPVSSTVVEPPKASSFISEDKADVSPPSLFPPAGKPTVSSSTSSSLVGFGVTANSASSPFMGLGLKNGESNSVAVPTLPTSTGPSPFGDSALKSSPFGLPAFFKNSTSTNTPSSISDASSQTNVKNETSNKPEVKESSTPAPTLAVPSFGGATTRPSPFAPNSMPSFTPISKPAETVKSPEPNDSFTPSHEGAQASSFTTASAFGVVPSLGPSNLSKPSTVVLPFSGFGTASATAKPREKESGKTSEWTGAPMPLSNGVDTAPVAPAVQKSPEPHQTSSSPGEKPFGVIAGSSQPTGISASNVPSFSFASAPSGTTFTATPGSLFGTGSAGQPAFGSGFSGFGTLKEAAKENVAHASDSVKSQSVLSPPVSNQFATASNFSGFGSTSATAPSTDSKPVFPTQKFGASDTKPAFSFGASSAPTFGSAQTVSFGASSISRPKTPPQANNPDGMETSPVQSVSTTPAPSQNGVSPFAFGGQPSFTPTSVPSFSFGAPPNSTQSFGVPSAAPAPPTAFAFSDSRPATPSSPFGAPPSLFGSTGAPASPFGSQLSLPAPSFGVPSQTGGQPVHSFSFSPVASPTLSPVVGGSSAPFVFGAGVPDNGSQTPTTPTTPSRRPFRGLPQRKKR